MITILFLEPFYNHFVCRYSHHEMVIERLVYLFLCSQFLCGACETESKPSRERLQGVLGGQEPEDFGLVALRIICHYLSAGDI